MVKAEIKTKEALIASYNDKGELISSKMAITAAWFTCPKCGYESWVSPPQSFKVRCGNCQHVFDVEV